MNTARIAFLLAVAGYGGCGVGSGSADAAPDIDNGMCGTMLRFTGDYVDWDKDTAFCGLPGSIFTIPGVGDKIIGAFNGRIDFCIPDQPTTQMDITPPAMVPDCKADKSNTYQLHGVAVANKAVILAGGT